VLKFNNAWRFTPPASLDGQVVLAFDELIGKIAAQDNQQEVLEHFKAYFASAIGTTSTWSSNVSWAESDLYDFMSRAAMNAPLFIVAFFDACETLQTKNPEIYTPGEAMINEILAEHGVQFEIRLPNLLERGAFPAEVAVPQQIPSLDEQANGIIQESLRLSEQFLAEGRDRQAVQEVLWLLETVSTSFQGVDTGSGTVQSKYFNKIADELQRYNKGKTLEQVLVWVKALHGYLSSPTGGGVRHGMDLKTGFAVGPNDARLFCNLVRCYINFLLIEHAQLGKANSQ
jgi:hypothetical protein